MAREFVHVRLESEQFPCEHVQIHKLEGREAISRLFSFDIGIVCFRPDELDPVAMEGADVTVVFELEGAEIRRIHGMIAEIHDMLDSEPETRSFRIRVVPRAFRLTLIETQEIYMDLSVPEIIQKKLELVGLDGPTDFELRLMATYPPLEFVVQYKESDLAFISRLTEHIGVSFFFEHTRGRDTIVFTDHKDGFRPVAGKATAAFRSRGEGRDVYQIESRTRLIPKTYVLQDYNYRTPQVDLSDSAAAPSGFAGGIVEYGAHVKTLEAAKALAQIRAEEHEAGHRVYEGKSDLSELAAGAIFTLERHPRLAAKDTKMLVVEIDHLMTQAVGTMGGDAELSYKNSFRATSATLTYRPARVTPKPRIFGLITGTVEPELLGDESKFAKIDEDGRYIVRFLFDTAPAGERKASRPVRMIQPHAGPNYGMHFPLKPGIEVLLGFIDGDPDRPLIVGSVPNPVTPSPVTRPNLVMNRIKTETGILIEMKDS